MNNRALLTTGVAGSVLAALCCATPILAVVFGAIGLTAWLSKADYVVMPALLVSLALVGIGLYRSRTATAAQACGDEASSKQVPSHK